MKFFLAAAVGLLSCWTAAQAAVDSGLLALVPADTKVLAGVRVVDCRNSPLGQYLWTRTPLDNADLQQFVDQTQLDPRRDLEELLFAGPGTERGPALVLARGTFDRGRLTTAAVAHGWTVDPGVSGLPLALSPGKQPMAFAFLDTTLAVMGEPAKVRQLLATRSSGSVLDPALATQVDQISATNQAWFVSLSPVRHLPAELALPNGQTAAGNVIRAIQQSSAGVHLGDTVQFSFNAVTRSAQDAGALADVVRMLASMAQVQKDSSNDTRAAIIANALNNMNLQTDGKNTAVSFSIPESEMEQLASIAHTSHTRRPRP